MDKMLKGMVREVNQQVLLPHVAEDGFFLVQECQFHGQRLFIGLQSVVRVRQMRQIFQIQVLVAWHQLVSADVERGAKEL